MVVALRERGVGSNFGTYASHVQPVYGSTEECPNSKYLFERQLALPMHSNLVDDDLDYVADQLREVLKSPEAAQRPPSDEPGQRIHPTAVLGPQVELGERNVIGPYCVLQGPVRLGDDNFLSSHVVVGAAAEVAGLPFLPSWEDETEEGGVEIGSRNVLKELVSVNTGWHTVTRIGDDCLLMNGTYLAHDTQTEDRVTISSGVRVGGHSVLETDATLGHGRDRPPAPRRRRGRDGRHVGRRQPRRRAVHGGPGGSRAVDPAQPPPAAGRSASARSTTTGCVPSSSRARATLAGLPDVLRTPIEAWWSRQADA